MDYGHQPAVSLPDSHAVSQALAGCPLVIVSEVAADTETSRYADIRFPALGWGKKTAPSPTQSAVSPGSGRFYLRRETRARTGGSSPRLPGSWATHRRSAGSIRMKFSASMRRCPASRTMANGRLISAGLPS